MVRQAGKVRVDGKCTVGFRGFGWLMVVSCRFALVVKVVVKCQY